MTSKQTSQALAKGIEQYLAARRDKKHEDYLKSKPQKKKGVVSKGINIRLANIVKRLTEQHDAVNVIEKSKKTKDQTSFTFQLDKYNALLALITHDVTDNELNELKTEYSNYVIELKTQHLPVNWLNEYAQKAKDISFATHVAKLTHSSAKGSSILDSSQSQDNRYLTTNSLHNLEIDTASSNAASLPVADVLKITHQGVSVLDCLKNSDSALFETFSDDQTQIQHWVNGLKQSYDSDTKESYFLSKQVYFPIADNQYHLLLPLTSSSMAQALHLEHRNYFEDEQTQAREQRKKEKYSNICITSYPNKAKLNITGSNHSNASSLNGKRGGKITLFSAQPPVWQSQIKSYSTADNDTLYKSWGYILKAEISVLKNYIKLLKHKQLSDSAPVRAAAITQKVQAISYALFDSVLIANQTEQPNWTESSQLTLPYQLLFEPNREDEKVKAEKLTGQWQTDISKDFAYWLNNQLGKKQLNLTPIHEELWGKLFATVLRTFIAEQEVK